MRFVLITFLVTFIWHAANSQNTQSVIEGGIKIGHTSTPEAGTIRWTGDDFEGFNGFTWVSLTNSIRFWGPEASYGTGENNKIVAADGAGGDDFGKSVAIFGTTAVVGAPLDHLSGSDEGSAYIFQLEHGAWAQKAKLTASDAADNDQFGASVAISDDVVIIGAPGDSLTSPFQGSAYVFEKPGSGWANMTQTAKLTASDAASNDYFGTGVSISGDVIAIGAPGDNLSGSAYIFVKPGSGWTNMTQTAKLTASDAANDDAFGIDVAISGDVAIVGALQDDLSGTDEGSAYVFQKQLSGWANMTETAKLTASDAANDDAFGLSVAISGDVAVVGATSEDQGGSDRGSVYLFEKPGTGWTNMTETAKLTASDAANDDHFGRSVAISGEVVVIGAWQKDLSEGAAYIFEKPPTGWANMNQMVKLTATDAASFDFFGNSVGISGNVAIVGANNDDFEGSAYIFIK